MTLFERFRSGDKRALARLITLVEAGEASKLLQHARALNHNSVVVGITGSPGSGKSTLTDGVIAHLRSQGKTVGVIAVDPSSPFSGGAILGDRIRMLRHHSDDGVYIRSLASRGALGGLSHKTLQVVALMEAFGFDYVLIETVGVGQSEVDVAKVADHTVLVLTPNQGDAVQAFKAGVMEIADVFVVNKYDIAGADRLVRELQGTLTLIPEHDEHTWFQPIVKTTAHEGQGIPELVAAIAQHREHLQPQGLEQRRVSRVRFEIRTAVEEQVLQAVQNTTEQDFIAVLSGKITPEALTQHILGQLLR